MYWQRSCLHASRNLPSQVCRSLSSLSRNLPSYLVLTALDDDLDEFMEKAKAARLVREKRELLRQKVKRLKIFGEYTLTLPASHILPNTADIYFHPTVNAALSTIESNEALDEVLTRIQPSLPEIVDDCLKLSKQHLANLVIDDYTNNNKSFDFSVLALASTLFHCGHCRNHLTLNQTVFHQCKSCYFDLPPDVQLVSRAINEVTTALKIRSTISFSLASLERFAFVLHSCGIDPKTTTEADLSEIDPIIECLDCSHIDKGRVMMRWLSAVSFKLTSLAFGS
jgi:hypothetical protein